MKNIEGLKQAAEALYQGSSGLCYCNYRGTCSMCHARALYEVATSSDEYGVINLDHSIKKETSRIYHKRDIKGNWVECAPPEGLYDKGTGHPAPSSPELSSAERGVPKKEERPPMPGKINEESMVSPLAEFTINHIVDCVRYLYIRDKK